MKRILKHILSALLVAIMLIGAAPIGALLKVKASNSDGFLYNLSELPSTIPTYPEKGQKYWVVFNEGCRNNRLEMSTFDVEGSTDSPYIVWNGNLLAKSNTGSISRSNQYSYTESEWIYDRNYSILSDKATKVFASNIDIYDANGNILLHAMKSFDEFVNQDKFSFNGHTYKVINENLSWSEAKESCKKSGGHLVTITSEDENEFVNNIFKASNAKGCWIGGYLQNDEFKWVTNEVFSFTNWYVGEPNNYLNRNETCLIILSSTMKWYDFPNNADPTGVNLDQIVYICEWDSELISNSEDVVSPTGTKVTILEKKQYVRIGGTEMSKVPGGQGAGNTAVCIFKDRISEGDFNNSNFVWTSGDDTILSVTGSSYDFFGNTAFLKVNILGVSDGTTTLTVTTSDGAKSTCIVTVTNKFTDEASLLDEEALPANAKILCGKYSDYIISSVINGDKTYISDVIIDGTTYVTEKNFMNGKELDSMKNQNVVAIQVDGKITEMNTLNRYISTKLSTNAIGGLGYKENEKYPIEVYFQNSLSSNLNKVNLSRFIADTSVNINHVEMYISSNKGGTTCFYNSDINKTVSLGNSDMLVQTELKMEKSYVTSDGFAYITIYASGEKNGKAVNYSVLQCRIEILSKKEWHKISESSVKKDTSSDIAKASDTEIEKIINENKSKLNLKDTIAWNASLKDFLNDSQLNALGYAMVGTIVMSEAPKQTFEEYLTDKILDKLKVAHKISVGLFSVEVPMYVRVKSPKYGMLEIKFTANATNYTVSGNKFGAFGNVDYEIIGGSGMSKIPESNREGLAGGIAYADINAFAEGMYNIAMAEIKKAYNLGYGNDFNKVCDVFFNDTIVDMLLKSCKKDYKGAFFDIMSYPVKKYRGSCPIEMRVYDKDRKLCAFASDEKVVSIDENVECELDGHTKIVTISGWNIDDYKVEITATGNGKMNLTIDDVAGSCRVMRTQIFNDYKLINGDKYELINGDILLDSESKIVYNGKSTVPTDDFIYDFRTIEEENVNSVSISDIKLNYKKSAMITPNITADEGAKYSVKYESSNPKVAAVDKNGKVTALKRGTATITCTVTDSNGNTVSDTCNVTVKYNFGQWLIIILLFGWIWYI